MAISNIIICPAFLQRVITVTSEKIVTNQITRFLESVDNRLIGLLTIISYVTVMTLSEKADRSIIWEV